MKRIGLRIDVDTFRGTQRGVPALLDVFARQRISGTFYFSVGPDNMGRHLWRLLKPAFLWKMLRTNAARLYGPEIILMGTIWPGPGIAKHLGSIIRETDGAGHEIGLHAWDHHRWQAKADRMTPFQLSSELKKGVDALGEILGRAPETSAVPGWKCNDAILLAKTEFPFRYNSDCRGAEAVVPEVDGVVLSQPQLPVTMPTYDEVLGRDGITNDNYNDHMLEQLRENGLNVLTIHAEAEGNICRQMFEEYVNRAKDLGYQFVCLKDLLPDTVSDLRRGEIITCDIPGREGWVSCDRLATTEKDSR